MTPTGVRISEMLFSKKLQRRLSKLLFSFVTSLQLEMNGGMGSKVVWESCIAMTDESQTAVSEVSIILGLADG
jgi:hypothetical protein